MDQVKFVEDGLLNTLSHLMKLLKRLLSYSYDSNWFPFQNIVLSQRIGVSQANYFSHYGYTNIIKAITSVLIICHYFLNEFLSQC